MLLLGQFRQCLLLTTHTHTIKMHCYQATLSSALPPRTRPAQVSVQNYLFFLSHTDASSGCGQFQSHFLYKGPAQSNPAAVSVPSTALSPAIRPLISHTTASVSLTTQHQLPPSSLLALDSLRPRTPTCKLASARPLHPSA